jgi:hypothetical protein
MKTNANNKGRLTDDLYYVSLGGLADEIIHHMPYYEKHPGILLGRRWI